jgi:hypothetical protein
MRLPPEFTAETRANRRYCGPVTAAAAETERCFEQSRRGGALRVEALMVALRPGPGRAAKPVA